MDKIKKLNLKKQLLSLKYCYEEQHLETKALISRIHNLENIFKITKQFIKEKKNNNFYFKNEKRYLYIINQKKTLSKNIDKQKKTFSKSILFNKYQELQKEKESLIQTIEEKSNIFNSLKNELKIYKLCQPYGKQISILFLNNTLDSLFTNNNHNKKNNNIISNNIEIDNNIKKKLNNINLKEKLRLQKKCEEICNQLKSIYKYSMYKYQKKIKEQGFKSCIINNKYNKTYTFIVEPVRMESNNSSSDSNSENDNSKNNELNSINDHIFEQNKKKPLNKTMNYLTTNKKKVSNKSNFLSLAKNETNEINNRSILIKNIFGSNRIELNNMDASRNYRKDKIGLITEINNGRNGELNRRLLKIKEYYYKCLDQRYELKNSLKTNISQIYNIKEKIKKYKKEKNNKENFNLNEIS